MGWLVWTWRGSTSVLLCILLVLQLLVLSSLDTKEPSVSRDDKGNKGRETTIKTTMETTETTMQTTTEKEEPGCKGGLIT